MPKLRVFSGRELCKLLAENGFAEVRQKGSHIVIQKKVGGNLVCLARYLKRNEENAH